MSELLRLDDILRLKILLFSKLESFSIYWNTSNESFSDENIVKKFVKWDKKSFEVIFDKYSDKLFRYLFFNFWFDKSTAEDVLQEVFIKLRSKLDKFDTKQNFENWLYRFVHNFVIDRFRTNEKHQKVINFWDIEKKSDNWWNNLMENIVLKDDGTNLSEECQKNIKEEIIWKLINRLDWGFRETIILYYFEHKTYDEIAFILWKDKNYVWTMIFRAKDKLKDIIKADTKLCDAVEFDLI